VTAISVAQQPITIRAGTVIDGKGGVQRNAVITVEGSRIVRLGDGGAQPATYDFSRFTVLPGLIDTHVHIGNHFGKDGRASNAGETPAERALFDAETAYTVLMAGFTTVQSIGALTDVALRTAIARGQLPGPRLLTSTSSLQDASLTADQIRQFVKKAVADGADLIKIFASKSIREGGGQTLSDEQISAACGEAKAQGKRIWVHAHAASAVRASAQAGCTAVAHGSQVTDAEATLMAGRGTYFERHFSITAIMLDPDSYQNSPAWFEAPVGHDQDAFRCGDASWTLADSSFSDLHEAMAYFWLANMAP
jgi:imidazolonepropionase-like amidohydrolase